MQRKCTFFFYIKVESKYSHETIMELLKPRNNYTYLCNYLHIEISKNTENVSEQRFVKRL